MANLQIFEVSIEGATNPNLHAYSISDDDDSFTLQVDVTSDKLSGRFAIVGADDGATDFDNLVEFFPSSKLANRAAKVKAFMYYTLYQSVAADKLVSIRPY